MFFFCGRNVWCQVIYICVTYQVRSNMQPGHQFRMQDISFQALITGFNKWQLHVVGTKRKRAWAGQNLFWGSLQAWSLSQVRLIKNFNGTVASHCNEILLSTCTKSTGANAPTALVRTVPLVQLHPAKTDQRKMEIRRQKRRNFGCLYWLFFCWQ